MRRTLALVLLGLGALLGFASGVRELRHGGYHRGHHGAPCYFERGSWLFEY